MIGYYLRLAVKSVMGTPALSAFTVLGIGIGVAVPTAMISIHHAFARNPVPHKSDMLFNVRVDSWDPDSQFFDVRPGDPPKHITYRDMSGLMASDVPRYETGVASARIFVFPVEEKLQPYRGMVRLCHADFFPMFEVPFAFGGPWSREVDTTLEHVIVLSKESNERLFGGRDSVGEMVRLGKQSFTVVGVLDDFRPTPQYYDVINNPFGLPRDFFLPFDFIRDQALDLTRVGDSDSWGTFDGDDPDAFYDASEVTWIQYWVELEPARVAEYRDWVDGYVLAQKELGRFPRPLNNRVTPLMEWMAVREVAPPQAKAMVIISLLFLVVCCLNLTGLLLGKFLGFSGVVGVHRAMGASRGAVFFQRLVESELVGVLGGVVGLGLAVLALRILDHAIPSSMIPSGFFALDTFMLTVAILLALMAGVISGVYPSWRACRVAPAMQLTLQ
jgi:putative ABC transport system permease protein